MIVRRRPVQSVTGQPLPQRPKPTSVRPERSRYARAAIVTLALGVVGVGTATVVLAASLVGGFIDMRRDLAETQRFIDRAGIETPGATPAETRAGRLLAGSDPADIQSQFQNIVKEVAGRHAFTFDSIQVLKTERAAGLNRLSLRLDGQILQANIGAFLIDLATGSPVIVLQALELRPQIIQSNKLGAPTVPGQIVAARVELAAYSSLAGKVDRAGGRP